MTELKQPSMEAGELETLRQDLAAAFRLCHRFGWSESVGNHFSAAVSDDGRQFLLNPRWQHFDTIRADDLLLLDADDPDVMTRSDPPDASAWAIHGAMHRLMPEARVILHCHTPYAVALSCLSGSHPATAGQQYGAVFRAYRIRPRLWRHCRRRGRGAQAGCCDERALGPSYGQSWC